MCLGQSPFISSYLLTFGETQSAFGDSAFIDDEKFAAHANQANQATRIRNDQGEDLPNGDPQGPHAYLVSGKAAPIAGYQHCAQCTFVDWGWWGADLSVDNTSGNNAGTGVSARRDVIHLGTWVAGDITSAADLPTMGSASFTGTALGTVTENSRVSGSYIARGTMDMSFDFADRQGRLIISDFGGLNASGIVNQSTGSVEALFSGQLSGPQGEFGGAAGAFVNADGSIAQGVIGQFVIGTEVKTGVGTFVGGR